MADLELEGKINFEKSIKEESRKLKDAFGDITVRVGADTSKAYVEIGRLGKSLDSMELGNGLADGLKKNSAAIRDMGKGIGGLKGMIDNTGRHAAQLGDSLGSIFTKEAGGIVKVKKATAGYYASDRAALNKLLMDKEISLEQFQRRSEEMSREAALATGRYGVKAAQSFDILRLAAGEGIGAIKKIIEKDFIDSLKNAAGVIDGFAAGNKSKMKGMADDYDALKQNAGLAFGAIGAAMGEALAKGESVGEAFLRQLLDMAQKAVLTYIPQIYAVFMSWLGPLAGPIAATAAVALVQSGIAAARGAIGAEAGVVGITGNYNRKRGLSDVIPVWLAPGETVISADKTRQNRELLEAVQTNRIDEYLAGRIQPIQHYGYYGFAAGEYAGLAKVNKALLAAIDGGIDVNARNFHKIQVVDKTAGGVKIQNWR